MSITADQSTATEVSPAPPPARLPTETVLPRRQGTPAAFSDRRQLGRVSRDGVLTVAGSGLSAIALTMLLWGRLMSFSGTFGFVAVAVALFILIFAAMTALTERGPAVIDRTMSALLSCAALVAIVALAAVVGFTIWRGAGALTKLNLYTEDMRFADSVTPLDVGGIRHALVGTLIQITIACILTVPLSITCAVYLTERRGALVEFVRTIVTAMTALPSVIAGLFIFVFWILTLGYPRSGLAASLALSIMMMPIMIRSADVVLRLVPGNLREASAALGAPQWRTVWHVVLPTARSGLTTAVILGIARGVGETAPVLLTAGFTANVNYNPFENAMVSLPLVTFQFVRTGSDLMDQRAFAAAAVLMIVVLTLFTIARVIGGRSAGELSKRQVARAKRQSQADLERIESLSEEPSHA